MSGYEKFMLGAIAIGVVLAVANALQHSWMGAAAMGILVISNAWLFFDRRRRRKAVTGRDAQDRL
jgi:uncharacterized membrane protein